jgi:hypothetical protein
MVAPGDARFRDLLRQAAGSADWLGRHQTALRCYEEILRDNPADKEAHSELGMQLLMLGRFAEGWKEYLHLYYTPKQLRAAEDLPPPWDGQTGGDGILVVSDQGEGDAVMSLRYARKLRERFARVFFFCQPGVADLADTTGYFDEVIPTNGIVSSRHRSAALGCEYHVPVMALPAYFHAFDPDKPPPAGYFNLDPRLTTNLRDKFWSGEGYRVGLAWRGKPGTPRDPIRSFDPSLLSPLVDLAGPKFFSLQSEQEDGETDSLGDSVMALWPEMKRWCRLPDRSWSLLETASFIASLDLVVTCDSVIAHVSGAVGVPTWVALPAASEWRWGLGDRTDWYPTAKLFRQSRYAEWEPVFAEMARSLRIILANGGKVR